MASQTAASEGESMPGMVLWVIGISVSVAALVLTAAMKLYYVHMSIAAMVSIVVALLAFQEGRLASAKAADTSLQVSNHLRHMGLVWAWGALALVVMYGSQVLTWREWPQFLAAFVLLSGICLFVGRALARDVGSGRDDGSMLTMARILTLVQLVAMPIVVIGLLVDGKMWRFTTAAGQRANWQDWGANNVFFFGALAIAALAWNAYAVLRSSQAK